MGAGGREQGSNIEAECEWKTREWEGEVQSGPAKAQTPMEQHTLSTPNSRNLATFNAQCTGNMCA
jgi:hypothetical protein